MHALKKALPFSLVLVLAAVVLLGCDSDDNGGNPLDGDLSFEVEGSDETTVSVTKSYFYSTGDGVCQTSNSDFSVSVPADGDLSPDETNCDGVSPDEFDGVRVSVTVISGSSGLTLRLLSDGETVEEADEATSFGASEAWVVKAGEVPDLSQ